MSKTATINARIEPTLKEQAGIILTKLGLTTTEAINLYFHQIVLQNGIPFELRVPNSETQQAIHNAMNNENMIKIDSFKSLFNELDDEIANEHSSPKQ